MTLSGISHHGRESRDFANREGTRPGSHPFTSFWAMPERSEGSRYLDFRANTGTLRGLRQLRMTVLVLVFLAVGPGWGAETWQPPALIPWPVHLEVTAGAFVIGPDTKVYVQSDDIDARWIGDYLSRLLSHAVGAPVRREISRGSPQRSAILLSLDMNETLGRERYELTLAPWTIRINAANASGLFDGVQTLRQMLPPEAESEAGGKAPIQIPCLRIQDQPRYSWRGLMLDCSRTFLPLAYLRNTLDRMALYKLNVLHLHLTDDQGWRLEIKKYPELTTVGAHFSARFGGAGGFYTQQEMRDLIAYARQRNITIVPEIEMPGHSTEVLAAYPELACLLPVRQTFEVIPFWEGRLELSQPLCAGNDKVFAMYRDILGEVMDLFPSEFIHVGGDEVPKDAWKQCPRCQARIKAEGLKDENELQSYFMRRIQKIIAGRGRRMIGWDEILEGGLAAGASVMSWRGTQGGVAAAELGHDVVMTPNPYTYFDYTYHITPTEKVYSYDPAATEFTPQLSKHILGVQACMWTHIATTEQAIDYQLYPRLLALAEVAWSPQRTRAWSDFQARLGPHYQRLRVWNAKFFDAGAPSRKLGAWQASDLTGDFPRQFEWEAASLLPESGDVEIEVRREDGNKLTYVRSLALVEAGKVISQIAFPGPLDERNDAEVGWLAVGARKAEAHRTFRLTLQGSKDGAVSGSVWVIGASGAGGAIP